MMLDTVAKVEQTDAYQDGIDAYLTLLYITPINALAKHFKKYGKLDRFKFTEGFNYAQTLLKN